MALKECKCYRIGHVFAYDLRANAIRFLWVYLQFQSICSQKSDHDIRTALQSLPKSLPEIFSRILDNARRYGPVDQARLLKLLVASFQPLNTEEIREAISVTHFDTVWDTSKLINNMHGMLATCGYLLFADKEERTLHFVHPNVKQFLLGDFDHNNGGRFTHDEAELKMANTVLTYLNYDIFNNTLLTTAVTPSVPAMNISQTIPSSTRYSDSTRAITLRLLLGSKKRVKFDIKRALAKFDNQPRQRDTFSFHPYAKKFFLDHTTNLERCSPRLLPLLLASWEKKRVGLNDLHFSKAVTMFSYVKTSEWVAHYYPDGGGSDQPGGGDSGH